MPAADRCGEGKEHSLAFFLLSQPCIVLSPGTKGFSRGQGPQSNSNTGQGSGTKCNSTLMAQDQQAEVRMQSLPLGSRSGFACLSGQVQRSKDTGHGLGRGLQRSGKGLPLPTEKSLRPKKVTVATTTGNISHRHKVPSHCGIKAQKHKAPNSMAHSMGRGHGGQTRISG